MNNPIFQKQNESSKIQVSWMWHKSHSHVFYLRNQLDDLIFVYRESGDSELSTRAASLRNPWPLHEVSLVMFFSQIRYQAQLGVTMAAAPSCIWQKLVRLMPGKVVGTERKTWTVMQVQKWVRTQSILKTMRASEKTKKLILEEMWKR